MQVYLSSLGKTAATNQPQWDKFGDEDLSLSSEDGMKSSPKIAKPNKFLKKKTLDSESTGSKFLKKPTDGSAKKQVHNLFSLNWNYSCKE